MRYLLGFLITFSFQIHAQEDTPTFVDGVQAYKSKDFQKSKDIFSQLLTLHPENPSVLYNLGLAEYGLGKKGLALGLWRKARFLKPDQNSSVAAIEFVQDELFPDDQREDLFFTIYSWLKLIPLHLWLLITFISLFIFSWVGINLSAKRKLSLSQWPAWQFCLIPLFLFTTVMSIVFTKETYTVKATVVLADAVTKTGPSETAPTLSNLTEGELVFVEKRQSNWVQIKTLRGAPGWVNIASLIIIER